MSVGPGGVPTRGSAELPEGVLVMATRGAAWADWVRRLPRLVRELVEEWDLAPEARLPEAWHGYCSLVLPVRTAAGEAAVLKLRWDGDDEGEFEHLALQRWAGRGAVRLLRADPHRQALLLERLRSLDLTAVGYHEAAEVVASRYADLHLPALPQLRTVPSYVERWAAGLAALPRDAPIPRRLVEQTLGLARALVADPASAGTLVHGDLHDHNVLAGDRQPWLVIDPKPMSGDPHYEPAPMLWNRWEEVVGRGDVRADVRRRFHTLVDVAGLDETRARDWAVVRMVLNALWTIQDAERQRRRLSGEDRDWVTRCVTIAKAVQE